MKKLFAFLCSLVIICGAGILPASAAGSGSIAISSASAKQGDSVTLHVNMTKNPGLVTMTIKVTYDTNALELTKVTDSKRLVGSQLNTSYGSPYIIAWVDGAATANNTQTGEIASFTFKIKSNAKIGASNVKLEFVDSYDTSYAENSFTASSGSVTVLCKTHSYGSYTKVNDSQHKHICTACGHEETANHSWNSGTVTKQPTCKDTGTRTLTCTACNASKTETIAKTNNHSFGSWTTTKAPTCTAAGTQERSCSVCGKKETKSIVATGHSYGGWQTTKEATCTAGGTETRICSKCGAKETRNTSALGHKFSSPTVTKQPTCTEPGEESGTCTRCNQTTTNVIKATGHKFGGWTQSKAPTCTEKGTEERTCSACSSKETREVKALGHDFEHPTVVKEATISTTGLREGKCKRCGETTQEVIPCQAKDAVTGIGVEAALGVFAEGTTTDFSGVSETDASYGSLKNALADYGKAFAAYQIGFSQAPKGEYTLLLPNAAKLTAENAAVYLVGEDGTVTEKEFAMGADGTISVKTNAAGTYAVVDKAAGGGETDTASESASSATSSSGAAAGSNEPTGNGSMLWLVLVIAVVVVGGGVIVFVFVKRKK